MGKRDQAVKSLMWYRGVEKAELVSDEMAVVRKILDEIHSLYASNLMAIVCMN